MPAVFISYRRADSASTAGRIDDQLVARFGRAHVFKDVDSIPPGVDFERYIEDAIRRSHAVLLIIGPRWLSASAGLFRRRLDDPADFVRVEIEIALRLGVPIIPLLVENAAMPPAARLPASLRPLATLNALPVRPDPDFHRDMERVLPAIERLMAGPPPTPPMPSEPTPPAPTLTQAPAIPTTPEQPPTRQPPDEPTLPPTLPAAPPLSPQGEGAGGEATHKRPAIALTQRMGVKPSRSPALGRLVATISALVLIAVTVPLLLSAQPSPLTAIFTDTSATSTASSGTVTTQAYATSFAATQTAQAIDRAKEYKPTGVGPCDTAEGEKYQRPDNPYYWSWSHDKGHAVTCAPGNVAKLTGSGTLTFYGIPAGFPSEFKATLTLSFHATAGDGSSCFYLYVGTDVSPDIPPFVRFCDNGTWWPRGATSQRCCVSASGTLDFLVIVTTNTIAISVNDHVLLSGTDYSRTVSYISIQGQDIATGGWLGASNFDLKPTTP
ncbi:MAG TPA: toll/interleukin-1 receptor domain-containing protein [Ktedonobacterales bacterium]|nr:toll/interleukin-1 receptor domain-containing protein [Ktedonobacterales bacterium]